MTQSYIHIYTFSLHLSKQGVRMSIFFQVRDLLTTYSPTEIEYLIWWVWYSRWEIRLGVIYVNVVLKGQSTIVGIVITSSCYFINQ